MKRNSLFWTAFCGAALATGCIRVSDTGYVGTWSRGGAVGSSTISIGKTGEEYHFNWKLKSADGKWTASCDKNSHCIEILNGLKIAEYQFSTRVDPATRHLLVQGDLTIFGPKGEIKEKRVEVDELILEEGNLKLGSYTFERNGQPLVGEERPQRHFMKVSNAVMEPGA